MLKKKCPSCGRKIERKFNYCPYCGLGFKQKKQEEDFGMLGRDDFIDEKSFEGNFLSGGVNKMMDSLIKQIEKQVGDLNEKNSNMPRGFKIKISTARPQLNKIQRNNFKTIEKSPVVSKEELERRKKLPKVKAESTLRRLGDKIIYEISIPGVKTKKDVVITKLENSIEIKAYSKDKCYYKTIALKVEIIGYYLKDDKLFLELRS
jgi:hypothetical protein